MAEGLRIYNLFPTLAGPVERWADELPRIAAMAFNAVYVNPFHYPGLSGSLYAVKDYYRLNPRFRGTPANKAGGNSDDELLRDFTRAADANGLRVIMDLVVNHTAKDSDLAARRPEWFAHDDDGEITSPFAVDPDDPTRKTVWGDLAELDYRPARRDEIVGYFEELVRHYAKLGFGGFRCDAAYKVPAEVWRRLIRAARAINPAVVFLAETVGAAEEEVLGLGEAGFDYLYNSVKWWDFESPWLLDQYEQYRTIAPSIGFPESHDTERLVTELTAAGFPEDQIEPRYRQAYALAAGFSAGVMMPMGFEFGWARPMDVVAGIKPNGEERREPARFDLSDYIAGINRMKASVAALNEEGPQRRLSRPDDPLLVLARQTADGRDRALILVNTDEHRSHEAAPWLLLADSGGDPLDHRIVLREAWPGAEALTVLPAVLKIAPLELRVLEASRRAIRQVDIASCPATGRDPGHHPQWQPEARIMIEAVSPEIDGGRYPAKRIIGADVAVMADLLRDGHDKIAAVLKYAFEGEEWRETPFAFFDNDRWVAHFRPDRVGRWRYTVEAWTDRFESWREDLLKKKEAGRDLALELIEGEELVAAAAAHAKPPDKTGIEAICGEFAAATVAERTALMLSDDLRGLMARADDRADRVLHPREVEIVVERREARFAAWYEMFPRSQGTIPGKSATFDDCIARLDEIAALGFDVVYLVPIHPIGKINRKGKDNSVVAAPGEPGSPYAIADHHAVNPELGSIADFRRFVRAAADLGMEIALDFAVQCAPDHPWVKEHKAWFHFRPDGSIKYAENPPKKYEDIVNVEFYNADRDGLWAELRDTVLFWVDQGVRIFRVDNPHTKPVPFWEWMIREVKARCPGAIFLAEAFTRPKMMRALAKAGFTQSYTYFTWRNTKDELIEYLTELTEGPAPDYFQPNFFVNTPDILPPILVEGGRPAFRARLVLAGTLSPVYGIYNGYELCENAAIPGREEYIHSEKYEYKVWDWDRPGHIKRDVAVLNRFRRDNPAMHELTNLRFLDCADPNTLAYAKATADAKNIVVVVVNIDPHGVHGGEIILPLADWDIEPGQAFMVTEAFTGHTSWWRGERQHLVLDPQAFPALLYRLHIEPS